MDKTRKRNSAPCVTLNMMPPIPRKKGKDDARSSTAITGATFRVIGHDRRGKVLVKATLTVNNGTGKTEFT